MEELKQAIKNKDIDTIFDLFVSDNDELSVIAGTWLRINLFKSEDK